MTGHRYFSACPFCRKVFDHDGTAAHVRIDGRDRFACATCVARLSPPPAVEAKPNGELPGAVQ